jgi:hypothetical protein
VGTESSLLQADHLLVVFKQLDEFGQVLVNDMLLPQEPPDA